MVCLKLVSFLVNDLLELSRIEDIKGAPAFLDETQVILDCKPIKFLQPDSHPFCSIEAMMSVQQGEQTTLSLQMQW
jgi:hypothetical protein